MNRRAWVVAGVAGVAAAGLFGGACSNGSPSSPTTLAPATVAPTTVAPTTVSPTTSLSLDSGGGGSETTWMLLFFVALVVAIVLAAMLVASRRAAPATAGSPSPPTPTPTQPVPPAPPATRTPPPPDTRKRAPAKKAPPRPPAGFPPTIGEAQPSANEEPQLQPSAAAPSDLLVHAGRMPRKGGRDVVVRAASLRGTASRLEQKERQDAYSFVARDKRLIVAVADGVGSLPDSGVAARIASRNACRRIEELLSTSGELSDASIGRVFESSAWDVVLAARERAGDQDLSAGDAARSMATTLVVGAVDLGSSRELQLTIARVGDSSAWLLRGGEAVAVFREDEEGTVVDTKTVALPGFGDEGVEVVRRSLQSDDVLILATDGFVGSWGSGVGEVADYFGRAWKRPPDHITFAGHVAYRRRSFDDDRTAIAVWV